MDYLNWIDYTVIILYFAVLLTIGKVLKNQASASMEDYFIGGRKIPWWAMGVSGMATFLDMAGTMLITSLLFILGTRGLFIEFRGGVVLIIAVMMLWTGKWHRRSRCLTMAEWMIFRFGDGWGGRFAQLIWVIVGVIGTLGMLAYLIIGAGIFLSMFIPLTPFMCSLILVLVAGFYTIMSGFYGVVVTDIFQSLIIMAVVGIVCWMAFGKIESTEQLQTVSAAVTGNKQWLTVAPQWETYMPRGYEMYRHLLLFSFCYLLRNVFGGMGSGGEPRYFGARNDRECGTMSLLCTGIMMVRWPMMISFAVLGIYLVNDLYPQQTNLEPAAQIIQRYHPEAHPEKAFGSWNNAVIDIAFHHQRLPKTLETHRLWLLDNAEKFEEIGKRKLAEVNQLKQENATSVSALSIAEKESKAQLYLQTRQIAEEIGQHPNIIVEQLRPLLADAKSTGDKWIQKVQLISRYGTINPETILPAVILYNIPAGLRGLLLIALIAAAMSTFDSTINMSTALLTRDIYQKYLRPKASNNELIRMSWLFSVLQIAVSFLFTRIFTSVNDIWGWLMMGLGAGLVIPQLLRFYWWRFNGGGFAAGIATGMVAAIIQRIFFPQVHELVNFVFLVIIGLIATIIGTYLTEPTDMNVLRTFYRKTRPFGFWGPLKKEMSETEQMKMDLEHTRDISALPYALIWQITLFLCPMLLVLHQFTAFAVVLAINLFGLAGLYFFWIRHLPKENQYQDEEI